MKKRTRSKLTTAEKKLLKTLGTEVRKIRLAKGLNVYDITGEDMPIKTRQHWQRIENGQKNINFTTLCKIIKTLNVSLEEICKGLGI